LHFVVIVNFESVAELLSTTARRVVITAPSLTTFSDPICQFLCSRFLLQDLFMTEKIHIKLFEN